MKACCQMLSFYRRNEKRQKKLNCFGSSSSNARAVLLLLQHAAALGATVLDPVLEVPRRDPRVYQPDHSSDDDQEQHRSAAQDPLPRTQVEDDGDGDELDDLERDPELDELRGRVVAGCVDHLPLFFSRQSGVKKKIKVSEGASAGFDDAWTRERFRPGRKNSE